MNPDVWMTAPLPDLLMVALSAVALYLTILVLTRINGLRSFSKMSSFDFAITIAVGSVIASTMVMANPPLLQGVVALMTLFALQFMVSSIRRRIPGSTDWLDNQPVLVMSGNKILPKNLDRVRMSRRDLYSKLRMNGITHPDEVFAVVIETTGDVSVIKRSDAVDRSIFEGIRDAERLWPTPDG